MAAKKKVSDSEAPKEQVQIAFRVDAEFKEKLVRIAKKRGLDLTNFVRSMVFEAIRPYENQTGS